MGREWTRAASAGIRKITHLRTWSCEPGSFTWGLGICLRGVDMSQYNLRLLAIPLYPRER